MRSSARVSNTACHNPDFNGKIQGGVGYYQLTQRNVRRSSAASAFLKPAETRLNLTVMTSAYAVRILIEDGRATGVELVKVLQTVRATREVLVTSGQSALPDC